MIIGCVPVTKLGLQGEAVPHQGAGQPGADGRGQRVEQQFRPGGEHHDDADQHELGNQQDGRCLAQFGVFQLALAEEHGLQQPEHVEEGHGAGEERQCGQPVPALVHDGVEQQPLAAETGQRRHAGHGDDGDHGGDEGERHVLDQSAHLVHVALIGAQYHAGDGEKQDALEEEMVHRQVQRGHPAEVAHQRDSR